MSCYQFGLDTSLLGINESISLLHLRLKIKSKLCNHNIFLIPRRVLKCVFNLEDKGKIIRYHLVRTIEVIKWHYKHTIPNSIHQQKKNPKSRHLNL